MNNSDKLSLFRNGASVTTGFTDLSVKSSDTILTMKQMNRFKGGQAIPLGPGGSSARAQCCKRYGHSLDLICWPPFDADCHNADGQGAGWTWSNGGVGSNGYTGGSCGGTSRCYDA